MSPSSAQLAATVKAKAMEVGFDRVGIADASPSRHRAFLRQWLDNGRHGDMQYLNRRFDERTDVAKFLPGAKSVICVAVNYNASAVEQPIDGVLGRVARYARAKDYHDWLKPRLYQIADWLRDTVAGATTKCGVDTVPVLERELSARAGVGYVGKNTCIIDPEIGSWLLLGEVVTTVELPADVPMLDRCGTCTRCIDACPTQALAPYQIDASKCISYLTIERESRMSDELQSKTGDWLFGCDICQDVCPHNRRNVISLHPDVQPVMGEGFHVEQVLNWTTQDYHDATRKLPLRRVKLEQWKERARQVADSTRLM
jgi:epoxyqueuosine reductase